MKRARRPRGKILRMKFGYNPNSSSLAMDVSLMLLAASAISVLAVFISSVVRIRLGGGAPPKAEGERAAKA
ncbi:MAG: hypothetical protein K8I02_12360 [Candidatus Methylomirabilis sp.]|nr:hypothetical protein [Deltaproteobacteria bacterium]